MIIKFNGNTHPTLFIISIAILLLSVYFIIAKEIHSTKDGGNWADNKTWIDSIIPEKTDDVIINGKVVVTDIRNCDSLTIMPGTVLEVQEKGKLHTYTIKMVNNDSCSASIINMGHIDMQVRSPCDYRKGMKK